MLKAFAILVGMAVVFIIFSLYCCLRVAGWEDEWLQEHSPGEKLKGDDGYV